jgi:hypothetical protein
MTQDEIIEMAVQAGYDEHHAKFDTRFETFAKLVADKKHQELCRLAEEAPVRGDARETRQNILHAIRGEA